VSSALFAVAETADFPELIPTDMLASSGLLVPTEDGIAVLTGIHVGAVEVEVRALLEAPDEVDTEPWEEVVELSVQSNGDLRITSAAAWVPKTIPALTAAGPGSYRVRAHATGRDIKWDSVANEPTEHYLFLAWPAPQQPKVLHKTTDRVGQRHRARVESTR
jgi:hypothetical protein